MDPKLSKWLRWLKTIESEIYNLVVHKDIFWSVQLLIKENEKIQKYSIFYRYLGDTYVSHALIGIRRQIKKDKDSISFHRLLIEITDSPKVLSSDYFRELYKGSVFEELCQADKDFNKFCGNTPNHISKEMVEGDIKKLIQSAQKCEDFADKRIAHTDKRDPKSPLTFEDVDNCINFLDQLICKYNSIFQTGNTSSLMPTYQYDWKQIFDEPWRKVKN